METGGLLVFYHPNISITCSYTQFVFLFWLNGFLL